MSQTLAFDQHVAEYEEWFEKYPFVFQSELEAIRDILPAGDNIYGIEVAMGTGRFAEALGIREGIEPSANMRSLATKRGIEVMDGKAESLPYKDNKYDFVLMTFCISYFDDLHEAFKEAYRVLKNGACLIVGFIDKESAIGRMYEARKPQSVFYRSANFYQVDRVAEELKKARFRDLTYTQTLFKGLDEIRSFEIAKPGYGEGSFVLIKAIKK